MSTTNTPEDTDLDLVWGAAAIGRVIGRNTRQTFYLLETGAIPARKVKDKWVSNRPALKRFFTEPPAEDAIADRAKVA